jgi:hypothetical protein
MLQTYSEEKRARVRPPEAEYFTVREVLAEASIVRPELTAEGSRPAKGGTIVRA